MFRPRAPQFVGIHVPDFYCVGTPAQLRSFLGLVRTGVITPRHRARVSFDLDRALHAVHSGSGEGRTVSFRPVERNVRLLQVGAGMPHKILFCEQTEEPLARRK